MEVMAYSQYFIHDKAFSSTLSTTMTTAGLPYSCEVGTNCQASNVMRSTLVIWNNKPGTTPCCIYSTPQLDPQNTIVIAANVLIALVILTPSDQKRSDVTAW
jgi:hypothetical protein